MTSRKISAQAEVIIVGAGVSGSFFARVLTAAGVDCLMLEAGRFFTRSTYPDNELDGSARLYWGGGLELSRDARLVFLRPKCVGGGSVVNQALVDRFDEEAFGSWREVSGIDYLSLPDMAPWYDRAEAELSIEHIPAQARNRNALIYEEGCRKLGYGYGPLRRAQKGCRYEEGNDCIACLNGCRLGSKQSMPETALKKALAAGLKLEPEFEVTRIAEDGGGVVVAGIDRAGVERGFRAGRLVLAAGAVGNTRLLAVSGFGERLPALGRNFFCHPQYDSFGIYDQVVDAHRGPFQAFKSEDENFRRAGFKLENVYAPPAAVSMLIGGFGKKLMRRMERLRHFACIEVCTRDTNPGVITVDRKGRVTIDKRLNEEDKRRRQRGVEAIGRIFKATGAGEVIHSPVGIGLHLMGGLSLGTDPKKSVTGPDFRLHGCRNIYTADSSVFPNAPGINPSLTIMALSLKAAAGIVEGGR